MADQESSNAPGGWPHVLVVVASVHGATIEIGLIVRDALRQVGCVADLREPDQIRGFGGYDAVVVGSAVYVGRWLAAAEGFVNDHAEALRSIKVWVFESGPIGAEGSHDGPTEEGRAIAGNLDAYPIKSFSGRLDRSGLNLGERAIAHLTKMPYGDFRDSEEIRSWARAIAGELRRSRSDDVATRTSDRSTKEVQ